MMSAKTKKTKGHHRHHPEPDDCSLQTHWVYLYIDISSQDEHHKVLHSCKDNWCFVATITPPSSPNLPPVKLVAFKLLLGTVMLAIRANL